MLKLGEKIIKDIYLGDKKIAKVFLGDKLVYQANKPIFLEYVTFDGASYIDTGIVPVFGDKLEIYGQPMQYGASGITLFSAGTGSHQLIFLPVSAINVYYKYFETGGARSFRAGLTAKLSFYECFADGSVNMDGKQIFAPVEGLTAQIVNTNLFIGVRASQSSYWDGNIGTTRLIASDGTVKLDLRPCLDNNGNVCFYDMVTKKYFYNQGTGELKAGGRFVKSIVFDGASYINTGVKYQTCTVKTETKFSLTGTRQLMGFSGSSPIHYWGCNANGYLDPLTSVSGLEFKEIEVAYNKDDEDNKTLTITVDGKSAVKTGKMDTTNSYLIGCIENGSYSAQCEVKYNEIYVNGELIQDLRPYVDEDGVACFYDTVTNVKFYNKGTGTLGYTE